MRKAYIVVKRIIDLVVASLLALLGWPLFFIVMIIIKVDSKGPAIFTQPRFGKNKKIFEIYKFRTMHISAPSNTPTYKLNDPGEHITRVGTLLRKTSLDELPQIFNIFKGEMSFIGPRPVVTSEAKLTDLRRKYGALSVYPGITGWAQVNGRDLVSIDDKAKLDGYYAEHISLWLDIKILFLTAIAVLKREGIKEGTLDKED